MQALVERIMTRYGTAITWHHGGAEEIVRGFFQPVISRSWQKLKREVFPLGDAPTGVYVYIGPVSAGIASGDRLIVGGREYQVRRTEVLHDAKGPAYLWGLCARSGEV